jgi:hypothetical protein
MFLYKLEMLQLLFPKYLKINSKIKKKLIQFLF